MPEKRNDLKKKILSEMTVDYSGNLEKNFNLAKQFVRITSEGLVDVIVKDKVTGPEQIQIYLIGKLYAKQAELTTTDEVGNRELMEQLGIPVGSLLPWLKELRDKNRIRQSKRGKNVYHSMPANLVENTLQSIEKKLRKKS